MLTGRFTALLCITVAALLPAGCSSSRQQPAGHGPMIRVRLVAAADQVLVTASQSPTVKTSSDLAGRVMPFPPNLPVQIILGTDSMWRIGNVPSGSGELILQPAAEGSL